MNSDIRIGIAIVQWNHSKLTINLIEQLIGFKQKLEIVITDNGSQIMELELLKNKLDQLNQQAGNTLGVSVIENRYNSGFSVGTNLSVSKLLSKGCEWIWLLNNDVDVSGLKFNTLKDELSKLQPSIVGTRMREGDGRIFSGSYRFNRWLSTFSEIDSALNAREIKQRDRYISGANMIVHHSIFQKIGMLNDRTFLYFEELDFIRRANSSGYEQVLLDQVHVNHLGSASSKEDSFAQKRMYHQTWSTLDYYYRHEKLLFLPCLIFRTLARQITLMMSGRMNLVKAVFRATFEFLLGMNVDKQRPDVLGEHRY